MSIPGIVLGVAAIPMILSNGHSRNDHQYSNNCCGETGIFVGDYSDKGEIELTCLPASIYLPLDFRSPGPCSIARSRQLWLPMCVAL